jgi:hypothetical protein
MKIIKADKIQKGDWIGLSAFSSGSEPFLIFKQVESVKIFREKGSYIQVVLGFLTHDYEKGKNVIRNKYLLASDVVLVTKKINK